MFNFFLKGFMFNNEYKLKSFSIFSFQRAFALISFNSLNKEFHHHYFNDNHSNHHHC